MNLLDLIEESPDTPTRVDVFDTAVCATHDDFAKFVPGLGQVLQTPAVGFWVDGRLVETAQGYDGRQLVVRVCNLDADEVDSRLRTVLTRL
ncbi:MAG TPA: hypothetical protein VMZ71_00765 [Gemmataceae bacterium]|nr:hypothetical protein [Gemmataceae bacterium]